MSLRGRDPGTTTREVERERVVAEVGHEPESDQECTEDRDDLASSGVRQRGRRTDGRRRLAGRVDVRDHAVGRDGLASENLAGGDVLDGHRHLLVLDQRHREGLHLPCGHGDDLVEAGAGADVELGRGSRHVVGVGLGALNERVVLHGHERRACAVATDDALGAGDAGLVVHDHRRRRVALVRAQLLEELELHDVVVDRRDIHRDVPLV